MKRREERCFEKTESKDRRKEKKVSFEETWKLM